MRLVNAEGLKEIICNITNDAIECNQTKATIQKRLIVAVEMMPTINVRENIHGKWLAITQPWVDTQILQCTCCGRFIEVPQYEINTLKIRYPFCHCGADMRGE